MYDEDDKIEQPQAEEPTEEKSPIEQLLDRLEGLSTKLEAQTEQKPAPEPAPEPTPIPDAEPDDPTFGFDPQRIVEGAAEQARGTFIALERVRDEVTSQFGDDLSEEDKRDIVRTIQQMPYRQLKDTVDKGGHLMMAYAKLGLAFKDGKVKQKTQSDAPVPMPTSSRKASSEAVDPMIELFEKEFGKINSKRQRDRLIAEFGGN